jgi:hypothetical protein
MLKTKKLALNPGMSNIDKLSFVKVIIDGSAYKKYTN